MDSPDVRHTANVLGATVEALARELSAVTVTAAAGEGGRASALTALAAYASGEPIEYLADSVGLSHSRCVRIVSELERDGLVTRTPGVTDRRTVRVTLTRRGRAAARRVTDRRLRVLGDELDLLAPEDRAALDRICASILARRSTGVRAPERVCRLCDPRACGHPDRCPVTTAARAAAQDGRD